MSQWVSESVSQSTFLVFFHMYLAWCISKSNLNLAHLHIQDGRQGGWIMLWTAYFPFCSPQFLLYGSQIFICITAWGLSHNIQVWLIYIFNMVTKMAEICSEQHIFQSAVHSFYCMDLKFSFVFLRKVATQFYIFYVNCALFTVKFFHSLRSRHHLRLQCRIPYSNHS